MVRVRIRYKGQGLELKKVNPATEQPIYRESRLKHDHVAGTDGLHEWEFTILFPTSLDDKPKALVLDGVVVPLVVKKQ